MYFKKTRCTGCDSPFDEMLDYCPICGRRNDTHNDFKRRHPLTFIPWYRELILICVGLLILNLIFSVVFAFAYKEDPSRGLMLINTASYMSFFVICLIVMFPYIRDLLSRFKIPLAYMWAGIGFATLIGFSVTYGMISKIIYPGIGEGGNQSLVSDMVIRYPLISILVVGIIGPICEEIAYRVGLFTLLRRVHPSLAYIGTAIIFGLIHFDFMSNDLLTEIILLQNYIFAGLCFSFIYDKKGFAASTLAHISNNLFSIMAILLTTQVI